MNDREIFALSLEIGAQIIKSGGEVSRAEDTVIRINSAYGKGCQVFALPSIIIAQSGDNIQIRHIYREETDLDRLSRLNALSRRICVNNSDKINADIDIKERNVYSALEDISASCAATASFCVFFGGSVTDSLFSAVIGIIINHIFKKCSDLPVFTNNLICAFISAFLAYLPLKAGLGVHTDKIIIGTIMLLVPGLTVVSAIRDMMRGDMIAGLFELFTSIMSALAIAFGVAGGIWAVSFL